MTKSEVDAMDQPAKCYTELLCLMSRQKDDLVRVTLHRTRTKHRRVRSLVTCYLQNREGTVFTKTFALNGADYSFLLNSISNDFPDVPFEDFSDDSLKHGKDNTDAV